MIFGLLFGIAFGFCVQRAGFCVAAGLGEFFAGKGKRILKLLLIVIIITSTGFLASSYINPSLGLKTIGQIRGLGFFNIVSGLLFGAGIILSGGCILGTLRQIGEGNLVFLITLISFIPGMAIVVYGIDPLIEKSYFITDQNGTVLKNMLLPDLLGVPAIWIVLVMNILLLIWFVSLFRKTARK